MNIHILRIILNEKSKKVKRKRKQSEKITTNFPIQKENEIIQKCLRNEKGKEYEGKRETFITKS